MRRRAWFVCLYFAAFPANWAWSADQLLPTPRATIYPGDIISDSMLEDRAYAQGPGSAHNFIEARQALVGKIARRTLLPHVPIQAGSVGNPQIVATGARVKIVFAENGLVITAFGTAMQGGGAGEVIRVRNQDSGMTVSGRIETDGSVRVSEG